MVSPTNLGQRVVVNDTVCCDVGFVDRAERPGSRVDLYSEALRGTVRDLNGELCEDSLFRSRRYETGKSG